MALDGCINKLRYNVVIVLLRLVMVVLYKLPTSVGIVILILNLVPIEVGSEITINNKTLPGY